MRRWIDTIAGRTILVLVLGLGSTLFLAQYVYQYAAEREVLQSNADRTAERLLVLAQTITAVDTAVRDETAHRLSGGPLELHWSERPLTTAGGALDPAAQMLRNFLLEREPELRTRGLIFGSSADANTVPEASAHTTLISLGLDDGTWLNVTLARVQATRITSPSVIVTSLIGGLGVVLVAVLLSRWLTRPLSRLADGARALFATGDEGADLEEAGTREVRTLAASINEMQRRIRRLLADRTQMLAAISHDLRTPLTRLRLRAEGIGEPELKRAFDRDIDEMEAMIDAALSFLRDSSIEEPTAPVDIAAILQTIADDAADAGQDVRVEVPRSLVTTGRHLALKRALTNLIGNAVRHGGCAAVSAIETAEGLEVSVDDRGPGIPEDKLEDVFAPFCRLDAARGRADSGYGLGLTVARGIARAHYGDVDLSNRPTGGLRATLRLPRRAIDHVEKGGRS
ncbi:MAG: ATP-binding protein [Hyphomicrobiaceae bacterium]|nr:ATP-binding protein [Hyphomicrobiaceae bacterium]